MTPLDLEILSHYYVTPEPHPNQEAHAVQASIGCFVSDGILEQRPRTGENPLLSYQLTEKGVAFLQLLLQTPYPKQVFVDDSGNVIEYSWP